MLIGDILPILFFKGFNNPRCCRISEPCTVSSKFCSWIPLGFGSLCVGDSRLATEKVLRALMRASLGNFELSREKHVISPRKNMGFMWILQDLCGNFWDSYRIQWYVFFFLLYMGSTLLGFIVRLMWELGEWWVCSYQIWGISPFARKVRPSPKGRPKTIKESYAQQGHQCLFKLNRRVNYSKIVVTYSTRSKVIIDNGSILITINNLVDQLGFAESSINRNHFHMDGSIGWAEEACWRVS